MTVYTGPEHIDKLNLVGISGPYMDWLLAVCLYAL